MDVIGWLESLSEWHWFAMAVTLVILDVVLGTSFFLLWLGISAATVAIVLWLFPGLTWEYQLLLFALESAACLLFWHFYLKNNPAQSDKPRLNRRSEQYIHREIFLDEPIVNGRGKVHIDDSIWRVEGPDLPAGARVKVVGVNGVILKVEPAE